MGYVAIANVVRAGTISTDCESGIYASKNILMIEYGVSSQLMSSPFVSSLFVIHVIGGDIRGCLKKRLVGARE